MIKMIRWLFVLWCFSVSGFAHACSHSMKSIDEDSKRLDEAFEQMYHTGWQSLGNRVVTGRFETDVTGVYFQVTRIRKGVNWPKDWQPTLKKYKLYTGSIYQEDDKEAHTSRYVEDYIVRVIKKDYVIANEYVVALYPIRGRQTNGVIGVGIVEERSISGSRSYQMPFSDSVSVYPFEKKALSKVYFLKKFGLSK